MDSTDTRRRKNAGFLPQLAVGLRAVLLTVALASVPAVSLADDATDAQRHFERAVRLYQERAFTEALAEFARAYKLSPRYEVLFNIAQVHYQLNEYAEALEAFTRYLAQGGRTIGAERRAYVEQELSELRERVGKLEVSTDLSGATVLLDDVELGLTPLTPVTVDIGRHVLRVQLAGHAEVVRRVDVASGEAARVDITLAQPEANEAPIVRQTITPVEVSEPEHPRRRIALWTLGAASFVLGAAAGTSFALAYRSNHDLDHQLKALPPDSSAVASDREHIRRAALASDVLGGCAIAAATGFVIALITTRPRTPELEARRTRRVTTQLELGPSRIGLRATF